MKNEPWQLHTYIHKLKYTRSFYFWYSAFIYINSIYEAYGWTHPTRWMIWRWRLRYEEWCKIEKKQLIYEKSIDIELAAMAYAIERSSRLFFRIHYNLFFSMCLSKTGCVGQMIFHTKKKKRVRYLSFVCALYICKRSNGERELFSMVEIVSERHEVILQYNNKNMHMIRISFYTHSSYLKRVEIMRHCRSYFRCSIRCCRQSKCHYREAHIQMHKMKELEEKHPRLW